MPVANLKVLKDCYTKLSEEEINNPHLAIDRFFDYGGLDSLRAYLWAWLKVSVSGTFNSKIIDKRTRYDMIVFYEHLEKIIEAAHILYLQRKKERQDK